MGLEVTMQWFAHPDCLSVLLQYAEANLIEIDTVVNCIRGLFSFANDESDFVSYIPNTNSKNYIWTIPFYISSLRRAEEFLRDQRVAYRKYNLRIEAIKTQKRREALYELLERRFPFPIAESFFRCQREHEDLGRFRRMLLVVEVLLTFSSAAAIISLVHVGWCSHDIFKYISEGLRNPATGRWNQALSHILNAEQPRLHSRFLRCLSSAMAEKIKVAEEKHLLPIREVIAKFIRLRNQQWGHGAMVSSQEYRKIVSKQMRTLEEVLERFGFLRKFSLFYVTDTEFDEFEERDLYTVVFCSGTKGASLSQRIECARRLSKGTRTPELNYLYLRDDETSVVVNLYPFWHIRYCSECKMGRFFHFSGAKIMGL